MAALPEIFSVSQVTQYIKRLLENDVALQQVWVCGEISNFTLHSSGHMYFTLKDDASRLRAVMFKRENQWLKFRPYDGLEVIVCGRIGVYPKSGEYQLYVEMMEAAGMGSLYLAFEQLKERLAQEGLFAPERKKPIPRLPRKIGVITSPTGAAVRDIIKILHRRHARVDILVIPAQVQGDTAPASLVAALQTAGRLTDLDLVIIGRGGGSAEELWAFNDEGVARAIAACPHPVISAVGHETDFTIADLVADLRAPTPSGAAELSVPEVNELRNRIKLCTDNLYALFSRLCARKRAQLERLAFHPVLRHPDRMIVARRQQVDEGKEELVRRMRVVLEERRKELRRKMEQLEMVSPLAVLNRGYSICFRETDGRLVREAAEVARGEQLRITFRRGQIRTKVEEVEEDVTTWAKK
ncbi:exodeoxyribonuclease VII large subunit [Capillibacterium thermochitinicola]|uniref:exodeoxyribonuclease VII large subunit n=1 Tax=Capillibacterium thermochitinicola TaxID=2699427 RepID=UPI0038B35708